MPDAGDDSVIRKSYRKFALQHHPDKGGSKAYFQEYEQIFRDLLQTPCGGFTWQGPFDEPTAFEEDLVSDDPPVSRCNLQGKAGSVCSQVEHKLLAICDLRSREAGFVLLESGELAHFQAQL